MNYIYIFISILGGLSVGYFVRALISRWQADSIEKQATAKLDSADVEVSRRLQEADIKARTEVVQAREAFEQSTKVRRAALDEHGKRLSAREENIERKLHVLDEKERLNNEQAEANKAMQEELEAREVKLEQLEKKAAERLHRAAGMTSAEAREALMSKVKESVNDECAAYYRLRYEATRNELDAKVAELISYAVKRYTAGHYDESMTTSVDIPNDEIKGRIIGRDGRNVRTIESVTGTTLLVDDAPGKIIISCFDPMRREIARQALVALIVDGRIHPASIEATVERAKAELEETLFEIGKDVTNELRLDGISRDLLENIGRLKFRSSYSQNCLEHSVEVAHIMGMMADELGLDGVLARRIGLFHDIGKVLSEEAEGSHAKIGAELLQRHGENEILINAVASHHEEVEQKSAYAALCSAADAISSSRPGARSEQAAMYYKRITKMELLAKDHKGVKSAYAVQAGHELRVFLDPDVVTDSEMMHLAHDVCADIESNLKYPGQIKVIVIRENRCVAYAR